MQPILLALALFQGPETSARVIPTDSYANPATADLVQRTRSARERNERLVTSYTATVSQRMGAGIRALSRDRMLYHQELSANISWKRDGKSTIEVTGARQALPAVMRGDKVPGDLDAQVSWLVVNPAEDYLGMLGSDADGFVYPLREGGEQDYRYAIGDTTVITLASGKRIRLLKLEVTPRRAEWKLMSGALWFDADTYGLVRAVFRPARPYDMRRDGDPDDLEDVPSWVNATGEVKFITMEYGLYEDRWWMLRYAAVDAIGNAGSWLGIPVKFERVYSDYEVEGGTPPAEGSTFRPAGTVRRRENEEEPDPEAWRAVRDSLRTIRRACRDTISERSQVENCMKLGRRRDTTLEVIVPLDTLSLLTSPTLGEPVLQMGDLITEAELRGLADAIRGLPGAPGTPQVEMPRNLRALLRNARFNRVEGLSLGITGGFQTGRFGIDALGRIGFADLEPNAELGASLTGQRSRFRLGGYRRLATVNPDTRPFGVVNSVWGVLAQRDDGDYFRSLGVEVTGQNRETGGWSWRLYAERQKPAGVETEFSLPHLFNEDRHFRPNVVADRADQFGASLTLRGNKPLSRSFQVGGDVTLDAAGGDYQFGRGSATLRAIVTPRALLAVAVEASAGVTTGSLPLQSRFYLGGPASLRGYDGAVIAGAAYWRGRVEVGNSFPAVRLMAFSDIGWAGPRDAFTRGRPLIGSGVGASLLDGLVRMDLSRALRAPTGWRFDLYFDGRL
jgi:surface antigen Omp85-like protein